MLLARPLPLPVISSQRLTLNTLTGSQRMKNQAKEPVFCFFFCVPLRNLYLSVSLVLLLLTFQVELQLTDLSLMRIAIDVHVARSVRMSCTYSRVKEDRMASFLWERHHRGIRFTFALKGTHFIFRLTSFGSQWVTSMSHVLPFSSTLSQLQVSLCNVFPTCRQPQM